MVEQKRVETGPLRVGDDWCGVFVRGDDAFGYALALEALLGGGIDDPLTVAMARGLLDLLQSCNEQNQPKPTPTVIDRKLPDRLRDYTAGARYAWTNSQYIGEPKSLQEAFDEHIRHDESQ